MKNKFTLLICVAILLLPMIAFGQKTFVSIGADLALPAHYEQSHNGRGTGFGGVFRVESSFNPHLSGIASAGYLSFAKAYPFSDDQSEQLNALPLQLGVKYYLRERQITPEGFFMSGELGIMPTTETDHITYTNSEQKFKETDVIVAPGVGYQLKNFELNFRFQFDLTAVGYHVYYYNFRIAYAFLRRSK